jgi:hypothetical protein
LGWIYNKNPEKRNLHNLKIKYQNAKLQIKIQKRTKKRETTNHTNSTNKLKKFTTECTEENKTHGEHREEILLFFTRAMETLNPRNLNQYKAHKEHGDFLF